MGDVKVIPLANAPGEKQAWGRPTFVIALWYLVEYFFVTNPLQVSSKLRIASLRLFGAKIGNGVIFRPRTRVKFPWNLTIGNDCWIGEGVWFHNQDQITIGSDVCISQETFLTTGSHRYKADMGLITKPIVIDDGVWVASRSVILGGSYLGKSCIVAATSVISGQVLEAETIQTRNARQRAVKDRF
jgi:putative colanic acid biosynthesis acetyltransferase WcaF